MKLDILLTIIIGFVTLFSIYRQWTRLEDKVRSQGERIVKLEQASRMRLPYKSYAEDARQWCEEQVAIAMNGG